jgi:hypothetical protein
LKKDEEFISVNLDEFSKIKEIEFEGLKKKRGNRH